jgi:hypothetical protein
VETRPKTLFGAIDVAVAARHFDVGLRFVQPFGAPLYGFMRDEVVPQLVRLRKFSLEDR